MNEQDRRRWQEVFDKSLESWEESITSAIVYDKEERCFQHDSEEQTAVEMYKEYFDHFWGRSDRS